MLLQSCLNFLSLPAQQSLSDRIFNVSVLYNMTLCYLVQIVADDCTGVGCSH